MKVFMAGFYHESNTFNPIMTKKEDFISVSGEDLLGYFPGAVEAFEENGVEVIPSWFSGMMSSGVIEEQAYEFFVDRIIADLERCKGDIDGIWLMMHGAIYADNIGSGELYMLRRIRKIVGYDMPVAVAHDPHGNISPDETKYANIIRAYHTAPHTDQQDTYRITAQTLVDFIKKERRGIQPAFCRLPMLLCGDTALTRDEPLKSVIAYFKELEKGDKFACASVQISMHSANTENTYPAVIIVPNDMAYYDEAFEIAKKTAHHIYNHRFDFKFEAELTEPQTAIDAAYNAEKLPVIMSDSGDNTTAGATGMSTFMLREFLKRDKPGARKVLISTLFDPEACALLSSHKVGEEVEFTIGTGIDETAAPVALKGRVKAKGDIITYQPMRKDNSVIAHNVTVSVGNIDVTVTPIADSLTDLIQFELSGLDCRDYDIIVIKQAYQFPDLVKLAGTQIMALTPGATYQDLPKLYYSKLPWTIYPFQK